MADTRDDWRLGCYDCDEGWVARYMESASEWADMHLADHPTHRVSLLGERRVEEEQ